MLQSESSTDKKNTRSAVPSLQIQQLKIRSIVQGGKNDNPNDNVYKMSLSTAQNIAAHSGNKN